jgi:hypothetical protein
VTEMEQVHMSIAALHTRQAAQPKVAKEGAACQVHRNVCTTPATHTRLQQGLLKLNHTLWV